MLPQTGHSLVKWLGRAVGTRQHHSAFHDYKDKRGKSSPIGPRRQRTCHCVQALLNGRGPGAKICGDQLMRWSVLRIDFEGEPAQRASELAVGCHDAFAIASQNRENARQWFFGGCRGRMHNHGTEQIDVGLEDFAQQSFFAVKKVIEAVRN